MNALHPKPAPMTRAETDALAKRRRGRNIALLVALLALAALFYAIAMVKMAQTVATP
jgi:hypothetical protein